MVNLLLLCNLNFTSSALLSWLSFRYQTGMQVFYVTPALIFWFIDVSSVFQLFSFLNRSSSNPPMPTKFHHHLQVWIYSMLLTTGSRPLLLHFGGATHHAFHPKYHLNFHQTNHWIPFHPQWLPQPTPFFFTLLFMAWTCWMCPLHSRFTWLLFQEREDRNQFQSNFEVHPFVTLSRPVNLCNPNHSKK